MTLQATTAANEQSWCHNGLMANTLHAFQVAAANVYGDSKLTPNFTAWTVATVPVALIVLNATPASLAVSIGTGDGNPAYTEYAIRVTLGVVGNSWVQGDGSLGAAPVYQTAAAWAIVTATWLAGDRAYSFAVTARNGAGVLTAEGPAAMGTTPSYCAWMTALFDAEWPLMAADLGLNDNVSTVPGNNIPERWGLASILAVVCNEYHPYYDATLAAYLANMASIEAEATAIRARIEPYKHVLAAILMINQSRQNYFVDLLGLENGYEVVHGTPFTSTPAPGTSGPSSAPFLNTSEPTEVFSEAGDLDGDDLTNYTEYQYTVARGGTYEAYVEYANDPEQSGSVPLSAWPTALALLAAGLLAQRLSAGRGRRARG